MARFSIIWDKVISDVDFHTADENCACETYYPSYSRRCSYDNNGTHAGTSVLDADVTQLGQGGETITYARWGGHRWFLKTPQECSLSGLKISVGKIFMSV